MAQISMASFGLRAFNANGYPVSGALCYVYEAGTTTPATTYSDKNLTTPHTFPVEANANGGFPEIYVEDGLYKVDITDGDSASLPGFPKDNLNFGFSPVVVLSYATRAQAVAANNAGAHALLADGIVIEANGVRYKKEQGATAIPDFLNFVPAGQAYFLHWGAVGDCTGTGVGTSDSVAIQRALTWCIGGAGRSLHDAPGGGYRWRLASGVVAAAGVAGRIGNEFVMHNPATQDTTVSLAFDIYGLRHALLRMKVRGGGADADYTQDDPVGGTEFLRFRASRKCTVEIDITDFPGRAIRTAASNVPYKLSFNTFRFTAGDIETLTGATLPGQVGLFVGDSAYGTIEEWAVGWEKYGSIFDSVVDLNITHMESGTKTAGAPITFKGCGSVEIGTANLGDETGGATLFKFTENAGGTGCRRVGIKKLFAVQALNALVFEKSEPSEFALHIGHIETRACSGAAILLDGVQGVNIENHVSDADYNALQIIGASSNIKAHVNAYSSDREGVVIGGTADDVEISGTVTEASQDAADTYVSALVETTGQVLFRDFQTRGTRPLASFQFAASNNVTILGGRLESGGINGVNLPKECRNCRGLVFEAFGQATIPSGQSTVTVTHGLLTTPDLITLSGRSSAEVSQLWDSSVGASTFQINVPANVSVDRLVRWYAACNEILGK